MYTGVLTVSREPGLFETVEVSVPPLPLPPPPLLSYPPLFITRTYYSLHRSTGKQYIQMTEHIL